MQALRLSPIKPLGRGAGSTTSFTIGRRKVLSQPVHHAGGCNQEPLPTPYLKGSKKAKRRKRKQSKSGKVLSTRGQGSRARGPGGVTHLPQPVVMAQFEVQGGGSLAPTTQELLPPPHVFFSQIEMAELCFAGGLPIAIDPWQTKGIGRDKENEGGILGLSGQGQERLISQVSQRQTHL